MVTGKIVFLLVLLAICVALSHGRLWIERRSRATAVIQLVSRTRRNRIERQEKRALQPE
jgi:hypothetical protein